MTDCDPCMPEQFYTVAEPTAGGSALAVCCRLLDHPRAFHGFGTRGGADDDVLDFGPSERRNEQSLGRLAGVLGFQPETLFCVRQVHGNSVVVVDGNISPGDLVGAEADALVTSRAAVTLGIRTADCVPVLLLDARRAVVAAAHAGWRGAACGVLEQTIGTMQREFGCKPTDLIAAVGPAIGAAAYEVGPEVVREFARLPRVIVQQGRGRPHLDLARAVSLLLHEHGVDRVALANICTYQDPTRFHSFRRDGTAAGRQLNIIGLR